MRSGTLRLLADRIRAHYRRLGYANAKATVRGFFDGARDIERYLVKIDEGEPVEVESLTFTGAHAIAPEVLAAQVFAIVKHELQPASAVQQLSATDLALAERGEVPWLRPTAASFGSPVPPGRR
jgi:hypothetical protein